MERSHKFFLGLVCIAMLGGCATETPRVPIKKVAIVSLSVNGAPMSLNFQSNEIRAKVDGLITKMVGISEEKISRIMQVSRTASFVNNPVYRKEGVTNDYPIIPAKIGGSSMVLFAGDIDGIKNGVIQPESAKKLCAALHVDAVMLIYSDWDYARGMVVPTVKAHTTNIITLWDSNGKMVYQRLIKVNGNRTLGVWGGNFLNGVTMQEWVYTFEISLNEFVDDMKNLTM